MGLGADWLAKPEEERAALRKEMRDLRTAHGLDPYGDPEQVRVTVEVIRRIEEVPCPTNRPARSSSNGSSPQTGSAA